MGSHRSFLVPDEDCSVGSQDFICGVRAGSSNSLGPGSCVFLHGAGNVVVCFRYSILCLVRGNGVDDELFESFLGIDQRVVLLD